MSKSTQTLYRKVGEIEQEHGHRRRSFSTVVMRTLVIFLVGYGAGFWSNTPEGRKSIMDTVSSVLKVPPQ